VVQVFAEWINAWVFLSMSEGWILPESCDLCQMVFGFLRDMKALWDWSSCMHCIQGLSCCSFWSERVRSWWWVGRIKESLTVSASKLCDGVYKTLVKLRSPTQSRLGISSWRRRIHDSCVSWEESVAVATI
jgi:hypothetical protein